MKNVFTTLNEMQADGVIGGYAVGGAVGATFYLEPVATLDIDVFVHFTASGGNLLITLTPLYAYLQAKGYEAWGEYILIGDWPVQFLPPPGPLEEEAVSRAVHTEVDGVPLRVMTAEHLVAIALATGRAKDNARLLQFIEAGALDAAKLDDILTRHHLLEKWENFGKRFLREEP